MMVAVPVIGRVGDRISSYFGDFGKLEGHISDTAAGSFLLELAMTTSMREKLATKLTWLDKKQQALPRFAKPRTHSRIIPANSHSTLTFADGSTRSCFIIDMSASGAALSADAEPQVGMPLAVEAWRWPRGRGILPDGFAAQFVEQQSRTHSSGSCCDLHLCVPPPSGPAPRRPIRRQTGSSGPMRNSRSAAKGYQTIGITGTSL